MCDLLLLIYPLNTKSAYLIYKVCAFFVSRDVRFVRPLGRQTEKNLERSEKISAICGEKLKYS